MARVSDEVKKNILADFHIGKSQSLLSKIYSVSLGTVNKMCKGVEPKNVDKVKALVSVTTELSSQNENEVKAVLSEVNERVRHIKFFTDTTIKNLSILSEKIGEETTVFEHLKIQEAILKGKETVIGKTPDTAVQVNVNQDRPYDSVDEYLAARKEAIEKY